MQDRERLVNDLALASLEYIRAVSFVLTAEIKKGYNVSNEVFNDLKTLENAAWKATQNEDIQRFFKN